jgi:hypothetical protein
MRSGFLARENPEFIVLKMENKFALVADFYNHGINQVSLEEHNIYIYYI